MGPIFEIAAFAPCTSTTVSKQHVSNFQRILGGIGLNDSELNEWLDRNAGLIPRHECDGVPYWYDIHVLDMVASARPDKMTWPPNGAVSARPYMISWPPRSFAQLDETWLQVGLYFDADLLLDSEPTDYEDSFPREVSLLLWKLVRVFSSDFGSEGVYLVHEVADYPWEVLHGTEGSLWSFHMALIPNNLQRAFLKPPDYITMKRFEDGIGFISHGTEQWPIVWQELPWDSD
jgi:hypothetical protein